MVKEPLPKPRRRSTRIDRQLEIQVAGSDIQGKDFLDTGHTLVLSLYGAKILLSHDLSTDQEITVSCPQCGKDSGARVVAMFSKMAEGGTYGIEFLLQDGNFWNVPFPPLPGQTDPRPAAPATEPKQSSAPPAPSEGNSEPRKHIRNYAIRLRCPRGDREEWIFLQKRTETLKAVLETAWEFDCATHGRQRALPLEATETLVEGQPLVVKNLPVEAGSANSRPGKSGKRQEERKARRIRVWVRGTDAGGNPFEQSAYSVDVSRRGGRLDGLAELTPPGTVVEVRRRWRRALFRVVWTGRIGTAQANQIGITSLQPDHNVWGLRN